MNNDRQRKVIHKINLLIDVIWTDKESTKNKEWKKLFSLYEEIITILRSDVEFTDDEIDIVSDKITIWGEVYVNTLGAEATTNYAHHLIGGHVVEFLKAHRNLHRYANIGWEAMNGKFKKYLLSRGSGGGHSGKNGCESIARALLR